MCANMRWILKSLVVLIALSGAAYGGYGVGRTAEFNYLCCGLEGAHNVGISVRERAGLLEWPSQIGQDRWVAERVFPGVRDGFYLDIGSADGVLGSNTWALDQRGWTGICIDPFPSNMAGRKCQMFTKVVDSVAGRQVTFRRYGELSGIAEYLGRWKTATDGAKTIELTTTTLADILAEAKAPSYIHFMSLDIEGAELEALKAFPFDKYKLGAMVIEHNYEEPKRSQIETMLQAHGYRRVYTWQQDDYFLSAEKAAK
jgi:FkbM family methyltransferase